MKKKQNWNTTTFSSLCPQPNQNNYNSKQIVCIHIIIIIYFIIRTRRRRRRRSQICPFSGQ